jgi:hypothetical protein
MIKVASIVIEGGAMTIPIDIIDLSKSNERHKKRTKSENRKKEIFFIHSQTKTIHLHL